jgi:hypothetical protein
MALFPLGILSAAGAGGATGAYDLLETYILGSDQASITFSSLGTYSSTYKHLQIRYAARTNRAANLDDIIVRFNGDSGNNYSAHMLWGNGSSVQSTGFGSINRGIWPVATGANATANAFGAGLIDILDAFSTTKNTTGRSISGATPGNEIRMVSFGYYNTASITSILLDQESGTNFLAGSRFSLYGIRG